MTIFPVQPHDDDLDDVAAIDPATLGLAVLSSEDWDDLKTVLGTGTPSAATYLDGSGAWSTPPSGGEGGAVDSVNGQIGSVTLDAGDVGALDQTAGDARYFRPASGTSLTDADIPAAVARDTEVTNALAALSSVYQAINSNLTALSGLSLVADRLPYANGTGTLALTPFTAAGRALVDDADAAAQRTTLGLGTAATSASSAFQAADTELTALAGLTSAADKAPYFTGSGTAALADFGSFARGLLALTTQSSVRSYLGLVLGTDVQPYDAELAALAGLTSAADRLPYFTGSGTASLATFTAAGRALVDDPDASAQRTTLGLGTAALVNTGTTSGTVPLLGASGTLAVARLATGTPDGTKYVRDDGTLAVPPGGSGEAVATSAIWDAKGDLAAGTGSDTADNLTVGANDTMLMADSAQAMGLKWAAPSVVRTALGLVIGTNVQPYDAELAAIAGLTSAADTGIYFTGSGTASTFALTAAARTVLDDTSTSAMRTTLGVAIGTNVQAWNAGLDSIAALTTATYGRSLLTLADASAGRTSLGLVIGTDVQAYNAKLAAVAGMTWAADKLLYTTSTSAIATTDLSAFMRTLLDDANSSTALTTLGVSAFAKTLIDDPDAAAARTTLGIDASTTPSSSTVAQGDVEADLDWLYANTAGNAEVTAELDDRLAEIDAILQGKRRHIADDFQWSQDNDYTTSAKIGEWGWLRTANGTMLTALGGTFGVAGTPHNPGGVRLQTQNNWNCIYKPAFFSSSSDFWRVDFLFMSNAFNSTVEINFGVTSDATVDPVSATPSDGFWVQKLFADTTWFAVPRAGAAGTRVDTGVAVPASLGVARVSLRKLSSTTIGVRIGPDSDNYGTEEVITWNPTATMMAVYWGFKASTATNRVMELDQVLFEHEGVR